VLSINGQVQEKLHVQFSHWLAAGVAFITVVVWPSAHSKWRWVQQKNCDNPMGKNNEFFLCTNLRKINGHWNNLFSKIKAL